MRVGARSQTPYGLTRLLSAIFKIIVVETTLNIRGSSIISTFIILTRDYVSIRNLGIRAPPMITSITRAHGS